MPRRNVWIVLLASVVAVGCGPQRSVEQKAPTVHAEGKKYILDAEPAGAKDVLETRTEAKDGDEIVMVGRIAGPAKPFVDGRALFSVTDLTIEPCHPEKDCPTPWHYCCTPKEKLRAGMAQVKFEGADGKTINMDARDLLGLREMTVVVVKGKAKRDDKDNLTVVASGIYPRADAK